MPKYLFFVLFSILYTITQAQTDLKKVTFSVSGNCNMCKKKIEESVKVNGVIGAIWSEKTKQLKVKFNNALISEDTLHLLIAKSGYDTDKVKASNEDYSKLHSCCKYERK